MSIFKKKDEDRLVVEEHSQDCVCDACASPEEDYIEEENLRLISDNDLKIRIPVKKDSRIVVCGTKAFNETYRGICRLAAYAKTVRVKVDDEDNTNEEVVMKKGTKERMSMGLGRLLVAMDKVKAINIKSMGKRVGSVSSRVAMPLVSFTDGVREGWTSRKQS